MYWFIWIKRWINIYLRIKWVKSSGLQILNAKFSNLFGDLRTVNMYDFSQPSICFLFSGNNRPVFFGRKTHCTPLLHVVRMELILLEIPGLSRDPGQANQCILLHWGPRDWYRDGHMTQAGQWRASGNFCWDHWERKGLWVDCPTDRVKIESCWGPSCHPKGSYHRQHKTERWRNRFLRILLEHLNPVVPEVRCPLGFYYAS